MAAPLVYLMNVGAIRTPAGFILLLYIASFMSAGLVDHFSEWYTFEASAFLGFTLTLFFIPLVVHAGRFSDKIIIPNSHVLLPFSRLLVTLGLLSIFTMLLRTDNLIEHILNPTGYRSQRASGAISFEYGPLDYITLIGLNWYYLQLAMFFIITIVHPRKKLLQILLFFSSLAYPLNALVVDMSRGGLLMWILMAALIYLSLYRYVEPQTRDRINKRLRVFILIIFSLFMLVSVGRGQASGDLAMYFVDYFSHQFGNFNRFYGVAGNQTNDIRSIFQILGYERLSLMDQADELLRTYGFSINVFATFIGNFIMDFSPLVIVVFAIAFAVIFGNLLRSNGRGLGTLFLVLAISEVFVWGVFYYNHGWRISNVLFLSVVALRFIFNIETGSPVILIPYAAPSRAKKTTTVPAGLVGSGSELDLTS